MVPPSSGNTALPTLTEMGGLSPSEARRSRILVAICKACTNLFREAPRPTRRLDIAPACRSPGNVLAEPPLVCTMPGCPAELIRS